jgi:hypothetical protein
MRRSKWQEFFVALFQGGSRPTLPLLGVYGFGVFAFGLLGDLLYDVILNVSDALPEDAPGRVVFWVFVLLAVAVALFVLHIYIQRPRSLKETDEVTPRRGLILILSPNNVDLALWTMDYHKRTLSHVWVLLTENDSVLEETLEKVKAKVDERDWHVQITPVYLEEPALYPVYQAVRRVYTELLPAAIGTQSVIADITGGFKYMSVGMAAACAGQGWPMSYVLSERDNQGKPIPGTERLIGLDVDFVRSQT